MLSDKLNHLFRLLQCSNTDIARFAGCSPSNISRMKSGKREPEPKSRSIYRLAEGVCRYADHENMTEILCRLCAAKDSRKEFLVPALIAWLYDSGKPASVPANPAVVPKSRSLQEEQKQRFGERLDRLMSLLHISNARLAASLNVDTSLVSRYRSGIYCPLKNMRTRRKLAEVLLAKASRTDRLQDLAEQTGISETTLDPESLGQWLFSLQESGKPSLGELFLRSVDAAAASLPPQNPGSRASADGKENPSLQKAPKEDAKPAEEAKSRYYGTAGLREAVLRFLSDAAADGGEMLLYSDEPMDWLTGNPAFFGQWKALMAACVNRGVNIRIIHNIDRESDEMVQALVGWLPLYVSGSIEPYVFRRTRNPRFRHTLFLRVRAAGIRGFSSTPSGESRWYDYLTDAESLSMMESDYAAMLSGAVPFLKTYSPEDADAFREFCRSQRGEKISLSTGFSPDTMPEDLFERILGRAVPDPQKREELLAAHRELRGRFLKELAQGAFREIISLPEQDGAARADIPVHFGEFLGKAAAFYTPEEYSAHARAVLELVQHEKNYHLTLIPESPFRDIQVRKMKDSVIVLKTHGPGKAFVFRNRLLTQAVTEYCESFEGRFYMDRASLSRYIRTAVLP